jgi:hypothetical protein
MRQAETGGLQRQRRIDRPRARRSRFACTIGPLPDETVTALFHAAENHGRICLLLPEPLLLDVVATERKELGRVRIVGRLVDPFSMSHW